MRTSKFNSQSAIRIFIKRFSQSKYGVLGLCVVIVMIIGSGFAAQISGYDPLGIDPSVSRIAPNLHHIMGTDQLGHDLFSELLYGARSSIYIGITASLVANFLGTLLGAIAGYIGGFFDSFVMRLSELVMTFPQLILVLICVSLLGQGVNNIILIFSMTGWMTTFRLVRGEFLSLREEAFVEADRAFGFSRSRIIFRHLLPNTLSPIVVAFTINIAIYIIAEAGLSFLGLGVPITTPTWGNLLAAAQSPEVVGQYWWLWLFPALFILSFVFGINLIGDGLRDVLDPKYRNSVSDLSIFSRLFKFRRPGSSVEKS